MTTRTLAHTLAVTALALTLAACGSGAASNPQTAPPVKKAPAKTEKTSAPSERPTTDMVAAVSAAKGGPPVELKFDLPSRPQIDQPADVNVALLPVGQNVERIQAKFQASDGLQLLSGDQLSPVEKPADGAAIRHTVRIVPTRDGIFTLEAAVTVETGKESLVRIFAIPVIAGVGFPDPTPKTEVAEGSTAPTSATAAKAQ